MVCAAVEGDAAQTYFSVFDDLIMHQKEEFFFHGRSRRPPLDNVNALLSFLYVLLAHDIASALETTGLDPAVGFLHRDRPGRAGLALDLMEELRPVLADRLALTLINRRQVAGNGILPGGIRWGDHERRYAQRGSGCMAVAQTGGDSPSISGRTHPFWLGTPRASSLAGSTPARRSRCLPFLYLEMTRHDGACDV
jgi:hypothetical protein